MSIVYPFPTLHADTLDYDKSGSYAPELERADTTIIQITHKLATDNLVASLITKQSACFFATVCIRGTIFRKTERVSSNGITENDLIVVKQQIKIPSLKNTDGVFVRPGVVLNEDCDINNAEAIGVSNFHKQNASIHFPAFSIIAFTYWRNFFSMGTLFTIRSDEQMDKNHEGSIRVEINYVTAIKINIKMSRKMFDEVERDKKGAIRSHILCTALTLALKELRHYYVQIEDYETELEKAVGLKIYLQSKKLPTWEDDNFDAAYVSSKLYPALLQSSGYNDS